MHARGGDECARHRRPRVRRASTSASTVRTRLALHTGMRGHGVGLTARL
jgi:hypothetical protein